MSESRSILNFGDHAREAGFPTPVRYTRLMLIGINAYQHWPKLKYPVSDCQRFFQVLQQHYGLTEQDLIHTNRQPLYDEQATTDMIYDELYRLKDKDEFGNPHLGPQDNLIVYYAGETCRPIATYLRQKSNP